MPRDIITQMSSSMGKRLGFVYQDLERYHGFIILGTQQTLAANLLFKKQFFMPNVSVTDL